MVEKLYAILGYIGNGDYFYASLKFKRYFGLSISTVRFAILLVIVILVLHLILFVIRKVVLYKLQKKINKFNDTYNN